MAFGIRFAAEQPLDSSDDQVAAGVLTLGSYKEQFLAPLHFWSQSDYRSQWADGLERLLGGAPASALVTEMYDPVSANFIKWWPLYLVDSEVHIQNQILFVQELHSALDPRDPYTHIRPFATHTAEGERFSDWQVPLADIRAFVECR